MALVKIRLICDFCDGKSVLSGSMYKFRSMHICHACVRKVQLGFISLIGRDGVEAFLNSSTPNFLQDLRQPDGAWLTGTSVASYYERDLDAKRSIDIESSQTSSQRSQHSELDALELEQESESRFAIGGTVW